MLGFQNTKTFLLKDTCQFGRKKVFAVSKIKDAFPWTYVMSDFNGEKIGGHLFEKWQITSQEQFRTEKVLKRKG